MTTITTLHGTNVSFTNYSRNGAPAHDLLNIALGGTILSVNPADLADALDGVVPGLHVTYTEPALPDATQKLIGLAQDLIEDGASPDYVDALADLIHDFEPIPGIEGGDEKRALIVSLLKARG
ncbi:hypothetical protein SEA_ALUMINUMJESUS_99 [Microbacterium phage AluminumJesus]|nr:hypothetical protein SEA_ALUMINUMJESUS_99 [Microbacterium phage AluminumJesus]